MRKFVVPFLAIALSFVGATAAFANTITVNIPDPSPNPFIFFGNGDASVTYSGVTFTQQAALGNANFFNVGVLFSGDPAVISSQEATVGLENILVTLPSFVTFFGVDYGTFNGSPVTFLASNGVTGTFGSTGSGYATPDSVAYNGSPIDWVLITSPDFVLNVSSVSYSPVPEPGTLVMLGSGVLAAAGAFRRRFVA